MELMPYLRALRRGLWVIVLVGVIGALGGWFTGTNSPNASGATKYYKAVTTLFLNGSGSSGPGSTTSSYQLPQVALLATSGQVPRSVASTLGTTPDTFLRHLATYTDSAQGTVSIVGVSTSPKYAVQLSLDTANALAQQLPTIIQQDQGNQLVQLTQNVASLTSQATTFELQLKGATDPAKIADLKAQLAATQSQIASTQSAINNFAPPGLVASLRKLADPVALQISKAEYDGWGVYAVGGIGALSKSEQGSNTTTQGSGSPVFAPIQNPIPRPTRAALGAIVAAGLAAAALLVRLRLDNRLRTKYEVAAAFGLDVIAEIPPMTRADQRSTEIASFVDPRGKYAESYRGLRTSIEFVGGAERTFRLSQSDFDFDASPNGTDEVGATNGTHFEPVPTEPVVEAHGSKAKVVLVTSALPAEGKTVSVSNLAAVLAESGASVLVVNCDYRRPQIANYLIPTAGATRQTSATTDGRPVVRSSIIPGVKLVTGIGEQDAAANPTEVALLQRRVIELARPRFDFILLDTAPMLTTNDATEVLPECDLVVLVCRSGKTPRDSAVRLSELLHRYGAPVLGVVMTDSEESPGAKYSYYYHEAGDIPQTPVPPVESVSLEL